MMLLPEYGGTGRRLPADFYRTGDVLNLARALLGTYLVTAFDGVVTAGRIVETEAYRGPEDRASHAYGGRFTRRTRVMYEAGGVAYVYLCYGIHHLFNVVTGPAGTPHAVLIRAVEPAGDVGRMLQRRGLPAIRPQLSAGPGVLSRALGITTAHTGLPLYDPGSPIWLEEAAGEAPAGTIVATARIGVDYAGEWANRPWRFYLAESTFVSGRRNDPPRKPEN